jgi:hypothetical protein
MLRGHGDPMADTELTRRIEESEERLAELRRYL